MNILGLTGQHKIARNSGRKFILKFSPQADFNFVQPCWPFVRGIHRSPLNSPQKGQWRRALMFSLICVWINGWVNNREAVDFRRYRTHYDIIVMCTSCWTGNKAVGESCGVSFVRIWDKIDWVITTPHCISPIEIIFFWLITGSAVKIELLLAQIMACGLLGAKTLSEPMIAYCHLDAQEQTYVKYESKCANFQSINCI